MYYSTSFNFAAAEAPETVRQYAREKLKLESLVSRMFATRGKEYWKLNVSFSPLEKKKVRTAKEDLAKLRTEREIEIERAVSNYRHQLQDVQEELKRVQSAYKDIKTEYENSVRKEK